MGHNVILLRHGVIGALSRKRVYSLPARQGKFIKEGNVYMGAVYLGWGLDDSLYVSIRCGGKCRFRHHVSGTVRLQILSP